MTNDDTILQNKQIRTRYGKPGSRHGFDLGQIAFPLQTFYSFCRKKGTAHPISSLPKLHLMLPIPQHQDFDGAAIQTIP